MSETMRAVFVSAPGGPKVLGLCERQSPTPIEGDVLVREDVRAAQLQTFVSAVERGEAPFDFGRSFALEEIQDAHRYMEANEVRGKLVVL